MINSFNKIFKNNFHIIIRFGANGVFNTLLSFSLIIMMIKSGFSPLFANTSGYVLGFIIGFLSSKKYVFRSSGNYLKEVILYTFFFILCFIFNLLLMLLLIDYNINVYLSQLLSSLTFSILMFFFSKFIIYKI